MHGKPKKRPAAKIRHDDQEEQAKRRHPWRNDGRRRRHAGFCRTCGIEIDDFDGYCDACDPINHR